MRTFRIALAQVNPTVGDLEGNRDKVLRYIQEARSLAADLVAFPELCVTGYPPEDLLFKPAFLHDNARITQEIVARSQGISLVLGFANTSNGDVFNAAAIAHDGRLVGVYHKIYLPNYGVFDEERYFRKGNTCPVYTINGTGVGVNICEDIWYAVGPVPIQREAGAQIVVNINGSPYHMGKHLFREQMVATRASDNELFVCYLNMVGGQDELVFDGGSAIFDPSGSIIARAPQFQEHLLIADLDVDAVFRSRLRDPRPRKEAAALLRAVGEPQKVFVSDYQPRRRPPITTPLAEPPDPEAEVYQALVTGARDYVRKCGFQKVVIGLSGGIDSSLVCCIAVDALGHENVLGVSMPSRFSSEGSIADAKKLAHNLGIDLWIIPLEPAHAAYEAMMATRFQGLEPGVAEENVQARIRGNILMYISNKLGWLVLSTGNKSELACGYATLYGDMSGGFSVIKDVPKTLVQRLARWRNQNSTPKSPIPEAVIRKPPSPELKPDQLTEQEIPPYDILDPILKAYVEEERPFEDIVALGFDPPTVRRVIQMVDRNEYKRRQGAPGVRITPRNFGKDRRMPIVNRYSAH